MKLSNSLVNRLVLMLEKTKFFEYLEQIFDIDCYLYICVLIKGLTFKVISDVND